MKNLNTWDMHKMFINSKSNKNYQDWYLNEKKKTYQILSYDFNFFIP